MSSDWLTNEELDAAFRPPAVTIIGASPRRVTARQIIASLTKPTCHFSGPIHLVNPHAGQILGMPIVASVDDVAGDLGLVYLLTPAKTCLKIVKSLPRRPVGIVVFSAGFAESGNVDDERALAEWSAKERIALFGPQSLGIANVGAGLFGIDSPMAEDVVKFGPVSVISQSGGVLGAVLRGLFHRGLGVAYVVSAGNQAAADCWRLGRYLLDQNSTTTLLVYAESIPEIDEVAQLARLGAALSKPVILCLAGRTELGQRAAASHTGSAAQGRQIVIGVAKQYGITVVDGVDELIMAAHAVASLGDGRLRLGSGRVGVISGSGGGGVVVSDLLTTVGVRLAEPAPATRARLGLPSAAPANPFDAGPGLLGQAESFQRLCADFAADDQFDVVVNVVPAGLPSAEEPEHVDSLHAFVTAVRSASKVPFVAALASLTGQRERASEDPVMAGVPLGIGPAEIVASLRTFRSISIASAARERLESLERLELLEPRRSWDGALAMVLSGGAAREALRELPVDWPADHVAGRADFSHAEDIRLPFRPPVVAKTETGLAHRAAVGGVLRDLRSSAEIAAAVDFLLTRFEGEVVLSEQIEFDAEFFVGYERQPDGRGIVAFGPGGSRFDPGQTELRLGPLTAGEAAEVITEAIDVSPERLAKLANLVTAVGHLAESMAGVLAVDLNPVVFDSGGRLFVLDAKIHAADGAGPRAED